MQAIKEAITNVTGRGDTIQDSTTAYDQNRTTTPATLKPISDPFTTLTDAPAGVYEEESGHTPAQVEGQLPESLEPAVGGIAGTTGIGGTTTAGGVDAAPLGGVQQYEPAAGGAAVGGVPQYETVGPAVGGYDDERGLRESVNEGQEQLLREREWDRRDSKQGRRDLPSGLIDKHPSLGDNIPTSSTPSGPGHLRDISTTTPITQDFSFPSTGGAAGYSGTTTAEGGFGSTTGISTGGGVGSGFTCPAPVPVPETLARVVPESPLVASGLGTECVICQDESGSALAREREQLLARAEQLEAEQSAHAAAAAEAARMRDEAARRAREIAEHLQRGLPARRQELLQQQEAAEAELRRLESARASVMERVTALEGQLSRLVEEERTLVEQRLEAERLRREIEATREGIAARAAELENMLSSLVARRERADEEISAAAAGLRASEEAVTAAAARLAELERQREDARLMLQQAEREREEVIGQLSTIEGMRTQQADRLYSIDTKHLPPLERERDSITAKEREIRQQTEALMSTVETVRVEAEQRSGAQQQLMQEVSTARAELANMETQAANLSCQEAALMARAAGAEGLEHGEQARAAAAAAEAAGLKAAAVTLSEAKPTTPTRHAPETIFSSTAATTTTAPLQRMETGSSSSSSSSSSSRSGQMRAAELDRDFSAAAAPTAAFGTADIGTSTAAAPLASEGPVAVVGPAAVGPVESSSMKTREIESSSRDFDSSSREIGEGVAPLPRPAGPIGGPVGGALLRTDMGGASYAADVDRNNIAPTTTTTPMAETYPAHGKKKEGLGKKIKDALGLGKSRRRRGLDTSTSRRRDSSPSSSSSSSPDSTPRAGMTPTATFPAGATTTETLPATDVAATDRHVTFDTQPEVIATGEQHAYVAGEPVITDVHDIRDRTSDAFADSAVNPATTAAVPEGEGLTNRIEGSEGVKVAGLTTGPGITDGDLAAGVTSGPGVGLGPMDGTTSERPIGLDGVTPYRPTGNLTAGPGADLASVGGTRGVTSERMGGTMSDMSAGQGLLPGGAVYSEETPVVGSRYTEDVRPTVDQTTGTTSAGDTGVFGAIKRMVMPGSN